MHLAHRSLQLHSLNGYLPCCLPCIFVKIHEIVGNVIDPYNTNQETREEDCSLIHTIEKKELE